MAESGEFLSDEQARRRTLIAALRMTRYSDPGRLLQEHLRPTRARGALEIKRSDFKRMPTTSFKLVCDGGYAGRRF